MKKAILTLGFATLLFVANGQNRQDFASKLSSLMENSNTKAVKSSLSKLEKSKSEEDLILAHTYYSRQKDEEKAEALKAAIIKKFPDGNMALRKRIEDVRKLSTLEEQDAEIQAILKDKPNAEIGFEAYNMAMRYAGIGDAEKMKEYVGMYAEFARDRFGNPVDKRKSLADMSGFLMRSNPAAALPLLADGLDYLRSDLAKPEEGDTEEIRKERRARGEMNYYSMLINYVETLLKVDRKAEALQLASAMRYEIQGKREAQYFERAYINALLANDRYGDALSYLEDGYINSRMQEATEESLKKGYEQKNGALDGFAEYMTGLKETRDKNGKETLLKKVKSIDAPDFELKDVDGKTVRLADLKGKVVVLDFWATWCGPCKASFPAMQKAVNKYKDDDNVKFLFIHTWEKGSGDPAVNAKKYVTDNKYTFEVLMDLRDVETKTSAVAKAYEVDGIPAKFIIDTKGVIRFESGGAAVDEDGAVRELSNMIEYAKKS